MTSDSKQIKTDFCQLIGMALQSKMSWKVLANILEGIIPSFEESKEVINILLIELEKLQLKLMEKEKVVNKSKAQDESSEDIADEKFTKEIVENDVHAQYIIATETEHFANEAKKAKDTFPKAISMEDNDIEILEVVKESMGEEISTELNGGTIFSGVNDDEKLMGKKYSGNDGVSEMSMIEIDNEWYTFVSNDKQSKNKTEKLVDQSDFEVLEEEDPTEISKAKRFQCPDCQKSFKKKHHLKTHERTHTGEMPYECMTCKKKFNQKCTLNAHERIHTGEVPYQCKTCKRRFSHITTLNLHERIHTGEKPYECKSCKKKFSHSCHMKRHERLCW